MRISTMQMYSMLMDGILARHAEAAKLTAQISSGLKNLKPSDDPAGAARALQLQEAVGRTEQYQDNITLGYSRLQLQESTLSAANTVLQRVHDLAIQANNNAITDESRNSIRREIEERIAELKALGNQVDKSGDYLFAGHSARTAPFVTKVIGTTEYIDFVGDQGERFVQISRSRQIQVGDSGYGIFMKVEGERGLSTDSNEPNTGTGEIAPAYVYDPLLATGHTYRIRFVDSTTYNIFNETLGTSVVRGATYTAGERIEFDGIRVTLGGAPAADDRFHIRSTPHQDVFTTLRKFSDALATPVVDDADRATMDAVLGDTITDLKHALGSILSTRTHVGGRLFAVESQRSENDAFILQSKTALSDIQDLDYADAISKASQNAFALQAAQSAFGLTQGSSLFDFLR